MQLRTDMSLVSLPKSSNSSFQCISDLAMTMCLVSLVQCQGQVLVLLAVQLHMRIKPHLHVQHRKIRGQHYPCVGLETVSAGSWEQIITKPGSNTTNYSPLQTSVSPIGEAQNILLWQHCKTNLIAANMCFKSRLLEFEACLLITKWFGRDMNPQVHYTVPRCIIEIKNQNKTKTFKPFKTIMLPQKTFNKGDWPCTMLFWCSEKHFKCFCKSISIV